MKQAVFTSPYTIEVQDAPVPQIAPDEVLLRVAHIGICGSDIQMFHGKHKYAAYPVVPGHEVSGVIEQVGENVRGYSTGDKVSVEPQLFCGHCYPCSIGRFNVCESLKVMGVHTNGFAAEYMAVGQSLLHPCPGDMDLDLITLVEPLAVGIGAVKRGNYKDANIAVIGAGTIGNFIAQAALALGNPNVLVTDLVDSRLQFAKKCGIKKVANSGQKNLAESIAEAFGNRKADIIIDAAATAGSFQSAILAARPSSDIIITGNYKEAMSLEVPMLQRREVNLIGHMMYVREDFADAIRFLSTGAVKGKNMITQRFALEQLADAFSFIENHAADVMKVIIDIGS